jgi:hypothetical protein
MVEALKRRNKERRLGQPSFLEAPWTVQPFNGLTINTGAGCNSDE